MAENTMTDEQLLQLIKALRESEKKPSASKKAAAQATKTAASGGSTTDILSSGAIASGNPYAMGAGLGLAVMENRRKRIAQEEMARKKRIVDQLSLMSQQASNLGLA